jgi:nitrogen fixation/metabolism regulation signal transduction histidine kinase
MKYQASIRDKLIVIFIMIKVIPLIVLALFVWQEIFSLSGELEGYVNDMAENSKSATQQATDLSINSSIQALDTKSRQAIERLTTDTARKVANFLKDRDVDIRMASMLSPDQKIYEVFLSAHMKEIWLHSPWVLNEEKQVWEPDHPSKTEDLNVRFRNIENELDFHYRPTEDAHNGLKISIPIYLEMTYVDLTGKEKIKLTTSDFLSSELKDISQVDQTFCKAETYFESLKNLKPGDVFVSEVVGAHVKTHMIGPYTKKQAKTMGIDFNPGESGYAGKENPVGKKFQGLIRWAMPVSIKGEMKGYVTLALDHRHIMEFTDHIVPTEERYSPISDAASGNYAFMWDYKGRNISHPRDYFIVGYDSETGEPAIPWLEAPDYEKMISSGLSTSQFLKTLPIFNKQSRNKKPSKELTEKGLVALDCRYLNFAPQCEGWMTLTQNGGSGSFVIHWSGLKKLTTAAAIPYYTGIYGQSPRGFGFVTIGANVDEFHKPAVSTAKEIKNLEEKYIQNISEQNEVNKTVIIKSLRETAMSLTVYTIAMVILVIFVAIWMASTLTRKITGLISGIARFQKGEMNYRLKVISSDEIGALGQTFNLMADSVQTSIEKLERSKSTVEDSNISLRSLLSNVIDSMPSIIIGIDMKQQITLWNNEAAQATEKYYSKIEGENLFKVFPMLKKVRDLISNSITKGIIEKEEKLKIHLDEQLFYFDVTIYPLMDKKINGAVIRIDNITKRVQMEEVMIQSEKMLSVGGLAAGMAHEINNPLAGIIQNAQLVVNRMTKSLPQNEKAALDSGTTIEAIKHYIEKRKILMLLDNIRIAGGNAAKIGENMLSFAKKGNAQKTNQDAVELFQRAIELAKNDYNLKKKYDFKKIKISSNFETEPFEIVCEESKILQVLFNIIKNAAEIMHDSTDSSYPPELLIRVFKSSAMAQIEIEDNGPGMNEKTQKRIFEPFFTTKDVDKGTGIGLSLAYFIIVDDHGGEMKVESTLGKGTTFIIRLPYH